MPRRRRSSPRLRAVRGARGRKLRDSHRLAAANRLRRLLRAAPAASRKLVSLSAQRAGLISDYETNDALGLRPPPPPPPPPRRGSSTRIQKLSKLTSGRANDRTSSSVGFSRERKRLSAGRSIWRARARARRQTSFVPAPVAARLVSYGAGKAAPCRARGRLLLLGAAGAVRPNTNSAKTSSLTTTGLNNKQDGITCAPRHSSRASERRPCTFELPASSGAPQARPPAVARGPPVSIDLPSAYIT